MVSFLLDWIPLLISFLSLVFHVIVAHRLRCEKPILECLQKDKLGFSELSREQLEEIAKSVVLILSGGKNGDSC